MQRFTTLTTDFNDQPPNSILGTGIFECLLEGLIAWNLYPKEGQSMITNMI